MPNEKMHCHLSMTNKTNGIVCFEIIPEVPGWYEDGFEDIILPPMSTTAITLRRQAKEELPSYTDKLKILMLLTGCDDEDDVRQQISTLPLDEDASLEDKIKALQVLPGFELHRAMLTAVVVVSEDCDRALVVDTAGQEDGNIDIELIDVHPTEPWVLIVNDYGNTVYIWNMQTKESIGIYKKHEAPVGGEARLDDMLAKFIPRKQWVVIGNSSGSIHVCTCPAMDHIMQFKAHRDGVTSLEIHPTRPLLLSCSYDALSLKLWDWDRGWSCTGMFDVTGPVRQVMFNPKHTRTFATCDKDGIVKMWRIGHHDPVATTHRLDDYTDYDDGTSDFFTYIGEQHFIAAIDGHTTNIWDLQKEKHVHTLCIAEAVDKIIAADCHPTRPVFVTASKDGSIHVWDSITYRLKKAYVNLRRDPLRIGFTGSRRLVIGYKEGISVLDIDLE